ncbi:hypothetical protein BC831DRAFT_547254, partial [Entophlyctis helioformis]
MSMRGNGSQPTLADVAELLRKLHDKVDRLSEAHRQLSGEHDSLSQYVTELAEVSNEHTAAIRNLNQAVAVTAEQPAPRADTDTTQPPLSMVQQHEARHYEQPLLMAHRSMAVDA